MKRQMNSQRQREKRIVKEGLRSDLRSSVVGVLSASLAPAGLTPHFLSHAFPDWAASQPQPYLPEPCRVQPAAGFAVAVTEKPTGDQP